MFGCCLTCKILVSRSDSVSNITMNMTHVINRVKIIVKSNLSNLLRCCHSEENELCNEEKTLVFAKLILNNFSNSLDLQNECAY